MPETTRDPIFESPTLRVYRTPAKERKHDRVVFTFHGWNKDPKFADWGFGEGYFADRGVDAIHFLSAANNWYQHPEMPAAVAAATAFAKPYAARSCYGSSMGGYAAMLFSSWLEADVVAAFSPQFSIRREIVPGERRWLQESIDTEFLYDDMAAMASRTARMLLVYDPTDEDDLPHVMLMRPAIARLEEFIVPMIGHEVLRFLHEIGLLASFIEQSVCGTLDAGAFRKAIRDARRSSSIYLSGAAVVAAQHCWLDTATELLALYEALPTKRPETVARAAWAGGIIKNKRAIRTRGP